MMKPFSRFLAAGACLLVFLPPLEVAADKVDAEHDTSAAKVFGWIEPVRILPGDFKLNAKLDTGADTSSLDAVNIRRVRVGEKRYVRYSVRHPLTGELVSLRSPYLRTVRIKRHSGEYQRRYVVSMDICLGDSQRTEEVNLIDRSEFDYPLLLGRSALEGVALVDSSVTKVSEPECESP